MATLSQPSRSLASAGILPSTQADGQPIHNRLLQNLPHKEWQTLFPQLVFSPLPMSEVLNEAAEPIKYAYFINSGLVSILNVMKDGKSSEVGLMGKEGFVGLPLLVGFRTSPSRAIVQVEGAGFRIPADTVVEVLRKCATLEKRLQSYAQVLALQAAQVAACNRLHRVHERLARWLLMSQDRIGSRDVNLTQESLANMLGVRRPSVTIAAGTLQKAGLIKCRRGGLKIMDRSLLEEAACECYGAIVAQSDQWDMESGGDEEVGSPANKVSGELLKKDQKPSKSRSPEPLDFAGSGSLYEKESREAEAKLAATGNKKKR